MHTTERTPTPITTALVTCGCELLCAREGIVVPYTAELMSLSGTYNTIGIVSSQKTVMSCGAGDDDAEEVEEFPFDDAADDAVDEDGNAIVRRQQSSVGSLSRLLTGTQSGTGKKKVPKYGGLLRIKVIKARKLKASDRGEWRCPMSGPCSLFVGPHSLCAVLVCAYVLVMCVHMCCSCVHSALPKCCSSLRSLWSIHCTGM